MGSGPFSPAGQKTTTPTADAVTPEPSSFRDPSGFVFTVKGTVYRAVDESYLPHLRTLTDSGLYAKLVESGWLVPHREVAPPTDLPPRISAVLQPEQVPLISYPYEWCFSALKDAALTTLQIQETALEHGMTLKDASAYNIQFIEGRPVLIDTLSFENYEPGTPWVAYRQFCQHFLAPLAIMARTHIALGRLSRDHLDGIPLDVATRLLPWSTRLNLGLFSHLHLHARQQQRHGMSATTATTAAPKVSRLGLRGILDSLKSTIRRLRYEPGGTEWADYYDNTNYSGDAFAAKQRLVGELIAQAAPATVWDLGANEGVFSRLAADAGAQTGSFDIDPAAVEKNYRRMRAQAETRLLPLVLDLTNPSPGLGWASRERRSLAERGPVDLVMALALVHHLAISNNVPLRMIAGYFATLGRHLLIEFVPKSDSQVQHLLRSRRDIFPDYHLDGLKAALAVDFEVIREEPVAGSDRTLLLARRRGIDAT